MALVHTLVIIDMESGQTLLDLAHEYEGEFALCGGGGSESTTNTVDYEYNSRMAALSEEQQEWAREYFEVWQKYQKPYEIAQNESNLAVLPLETSLYKEQLNAAASLLPDDKKLIRGELTEAQVLVPLEGTLAQAQLNTAMNLLPGEIGLYESRISAASQIVPGQTALYEQTVENAAALMPLETGLYQKQVAYAEAMLGDEQGFYGESINAAREVLKLETGLYRAELANVADILPGEKEYYEQGLAQARRLLPEQEKAGEKFLLAIDRGIDVNERMALAMADAAKAFEDMEGQNLRANARLGINPASGRFQCARAMLETQKAAQIASAVSQARVQGEQENFERMGHGASYNGAGAALQDVLPARPQAAPLNGAQLAAQGGLPLKAQPGGNQALANIQASNAVKPDAGKMDSFASAAINTSREIIGKTPTGASSELLRGVNYLKG